MSLNFTPSQFSNSQNFSEQNFSLIPEQDSTTEKIELTAFQTMQEPSPFSLEEDDTNYAFIDPFNSLNQKIFQVFQAYIQPYQQQLEEQKSKLEALENAYRLVSQQLNEEVSKNEILKHELAKIKENSLYDSIAINTHAIDIQNLKTKFSDNKNQILRNLDANDNPLAQTSNSLDQKPKFQYGICDTTKKVLFESIKKTVNPAHVFIFQEKSIEVLNILQTKNFSNFFPVISKTSPFYLHLRLLSDTDGIKKIASELIDFFYLRIIDSTFINTFTKEDIVPEKFITIRNHMIFKFSIHSKFKYSGYLANFYIGNFKIKENIFIAPYIKNNQPPINKIPSVTNFIQGKGSFYPNNPDIMAPFKQDRSFDKPLSIFGKQALKDFEETLSDYLFPSSLENSKIPYSRNSIKDITPDSENMEIIAEGNIP